MIINFKGKQINTRPNQDLVKKSVEDFMKVKHLVEEFITKKPADKDYFDTIFGKEND